tara:strand:+ start:1738 stop:2457 length:720 start_codon:yes stop_codon:yes gene_type:complete
MSFKLSVLLPVINEVKLLNETINTILQQNEQEIYEIIIITSDLKTSHDSKRLAQKLANTTDKIKTISQKRKLLGGALQDGFDFSSGTHVMLMASDKETEPEDVKKFIKKSKENLSSIITGNRWISGGGFRSYSYSKYVFNFFFQKIFSILYLTSLSDLTFGYRLFPLEIVKKINWEEVNHAFLFETIIKPIKIGVNVIEIPCTWSKRSSGESTFQLSYYLDYFKIGFKTLFKSKNSIIK